MSQRKLKLMTHVVAGYPNYQTTVDLILLMNKVGVDYVEIQLPFNDPIGDGTTIVDASNVALENGMTVEKGFRLIEEIIPKVSFPVFIMTYSNIPFHMGYERFVKRAKDCGVKGLIIPDMPLEGEEEFWSAVKKYEMANIIVVSPNTPQKRLDGLREKVNYMVYSTLKVGITGSSKGTIPVEFLMKLKQSVNVPIATGFGIDDISKIEPLKGYSDVVVIGSHVLRLLKQEGLKSVEAFLKDVKMEIERLNA